MLAQRSLRVVGAFAIMTMLACSSGVPMTRGDAIAAADPKRLIVHLRSGERIVTKRVVVSDLWIEVRTTVVDGKEVELTDPRIIYWEDVDKLEQMKFDDAETIGLMLVIGGIVYLLVQASDFGIGAN